MDRNIAILANENYIGVAVAFADPANVPTTKLKTYTYVAPTSMNLVVGDVVLVPTDRGEYSMSLATVVEVDAMLRPDMDFDYKHIIQVVDMTDFADRITQDQTVQRALTEAYTREGRKNIRHNVLSMLPSDKAAELDKILGSNVITITARPPAVE